MSVFKKDTVVTTFPAYVIVTRQADNDGFVNLTARDELRYKGRVYTVDSAISSALANNEDPLASYKREKSLGFKTHWISQNCVTLTNAKTEQRKLVLVDLDTYYRFEGKIFTIVTAPNDNLNFSEVKVNLG